MVNRAIAASPRAFGCTITGFVPTSTGSTQRFVIDWHASRRVRATHGAR